MPRPAIDRIAVIVPARDEQRLLIAALSGLRAAAARLAPAIETTVLVVANGCSDRTAEVAAAGGAIALEMDAPNVGAARGAGFAHAIGLPGRTDRLWLATTDADSRVPADWLQRHVTAAAGGADVHLGTVALDTAQRTRFATWTARYAADHEGVGRHGHVHGASMGMRAQAYLRAGGFRSLERSEDLDLVSRLVAAGARLSWDAGSPVITSARLAARAPAGVARDLELSLDDWDEAV